MSKGNGEAMPFRERSQALSLCVILRLDFVCLSNDAINGWNQNDALSLLLTIMRGGRNRALVQFGLWERLEGC